MCLFRLPRFRTGSRPGGKKAEQYIATDYLDTVLSNFSGYIAADELYDGPFCVLSIVDNHNFQRLVYEVLDHDPTHDDIIRFFRHFKKELDARGLTLQGITTDGSSLYPVPIAGVFGDDMQHQVCEFHVIKELTKAVLRAVAKVRKQLKTTMPTLGRGRPSKRTKKTSQRKKRIEKKITDLFDRRCRTDTALDKLAGLRRRVRRFKHVGRALNKLFSPNLDKALTFLDDSLLPSTSNAVERGFRRHRKMQKTVYRVRTRVQISRRIAVDMLRDAQAHGRTQTTQSLHNERNGYQ